MHTQWKHSANTIILDEINYFDYLAISYKVKHQLIMAICIYPGLLGYSCFKVPGSRDKAKEGHHYLILQRLR